MQCTVIPFGIFFNGGSCVCAQTLITIQYLLLTGLQFYVRSVILINSWLGGGEKYYKQTKARHTDRFGGPELNEKQSFY